MAWPCSSPVAPLYVAGPETWKRNLPGNATGLLGYIPVPVKQKTLRPVGSHGGHRTPEAHAWVRTTSAGNRAAPWETALQACSAAGFRSTASEKYGFQQGCNDVLETSFKKLVNYCVFPKILQRHAHTKFDFAVRQCRFLQKADMSRALHDRSWARFRSLKERYLFIIETLPWAPAEFFIRLTSHVGW